MNDYFARIEYQNRGSPHIFLWIEDAPAVHQSSIHNVITRHYKLAEYPYLLSIFSTGMGCRHWHTVPVLFVLNRPLAELHYLVKRLQIHKHTKSRTRIKVCRFRFPRPETEKTLILNNVDITDPHLRGRFYETKRTEQEQYVNCQCLQTIPVEKMESKYGYSASV